MAPGGHRARIAACLGALVIPAVAHPATYDPTLYSDKISLKEGLPRESVQAVTQDGIGVIWIGTASGLARYNGVEVRPYAEDQEKHRLSDTNIVALHTDARGDVW